MEKKMPENHFVENRGRENVVACVGCIFLTGATLVYFRVFRLSIRENSGEFSPSRCQVLCAVHTVHPSFCRCGRVTSGYNTMTIGCYAKGRWLVSYRV